MLIAIFGPLVAPHAADEFVAIPFSAPGNGTVFGTDYLGQDVLSRFLYGGPNILILAIVATAIGLVFGARHRPGGGVRAQLARRRPDAGDGRDHGVPADHAGAGRGQPWSGRRTG